MRRPKPKSPTNRKRTEIIVCTEGKPLSKKTAEALMEMFQEAYRELIRKELAEKRRKKK
jgi:hypothetical protein